MKKFFASLVNLLIIKFVLLFAPMTLSAALANNTSQVNLETNPALVIANTLSVNGMEKDQISKGSSMRVMSSLVRLYRLAESANCQIGTANPMIRYYNIGQYSISFKAILPIQSPTSACYEAILLNGGKDSNRPDASDPQVNVVVFQRDTPISSGNLYKLSKDSSEPSLIGFNYAKNNVTYEGGIDVFMQQMRTSWSSSSLIQEIFDFDPKKSNRFTKFKTTIYIDIIPTLVYAKNRSD